jgi:hypothetical protein
VNLSHGQAIRVIAAPFFLGTKMEAFRARGRMDFQASHDLEDFVAVIEGRNTLLQEIAESPQDLQDYLAEAAKSIPHVWCDKGKKEQVGFGSLAAKNTTGSAK